MAGTGMPAGKERETPENVQSVSGMLKKKPCAEHKADAEQKIVAEGKTEKLFLVICKTVAQHRERKLQYAGNDKEERNAAEDLLLLRVLPKKNAEEDKQEKTVENHISQEAARNKISPPARPIVSAGYRIMVRVTVILPVIDAKTGIQFPRFRCGMIHHPPEFCRMRQIPAEDREHADMVIECSVSFLGERSVNILTVIGKLYIFSNVCRHGSIDPQCFHIPDRIIRDHKDPVKICLPHGMLLRNTVLGTVCLIDVDSGKNECDT